MKRIAGNDDDYHQYRDLPYQRQKWNTIPSSQLSAIIGQRTYSQRRNLTPGSTIPRTNGISNSSNNPIETQVHEDAHDPDNEDKDEDQV